MEKPLTFGLLDAVETRFIQPAGTEKSRMKLLLGRPPQVGDVVDFKGESYKVVSRLHDEYQLEKI